MEQTKQSQLICSDDVWNDRFVELQEYKLEHGHCNVPSRSVEKPALGSWVAQQRTHHKNFVARNGKPVGHLTQERIDMLDVIGFCWSLYRKTTEEIKVAWMVRFAELQEYKKENGHCRVPYRFQANPKLGGWVSQQRVNYKKFTQGAKGVGSMMNQERIKMLEEIGFCWSVGTGNRNHPDPLLNKSGGSDTWMVQFEELKKFEAKHGHCNVPSRFAAKPALGNWVSRQRTHHKNFVARNGKHVGHLTQERIDMLNGIGFCWSLSRKQKEEAQDTWIVRFAELQEYKKEHGHCKVPYRFRANPKLGAWVSQQRVNYKRFMEGTEKGVSMMKQERINMLDEIGFCWSVGTGNRDPLPKESGENDPWMVQFKELKRFEAKHGHCDVPSRFADIPALGNWVCQQRTHHKNFVARNGKPTGHLTQERINMLDGIGFCWSLSQKTMEEAKETWMVRFAELQEYEKENGHCKVPYRFQANPKLGGWVSQQRVNYKRFMEGAKGVGSMMNQERINMLEEIGFCWTVGMGRGSSAAPPTVESRQELVALDPRPMHNSPGDDWCESPAKRQRVDTGEELILF